MAIIFWLGVGVESLSILLPIQVPIVEWYPWVAAVHLLGAMSSGERLFIWVSSMAGVILSYIALPLLVLELSIRHAAYRLEKRSLITYISSRFTALHRSSHLISHG